MISIATILQRQYSLIQTELVRYLNNPYDAERTHDLRVSIRTLRGLFKFLKRKLPQTVFLDVNKNLGNAAKTFNLLRELDVLIAKSSAFAYAHPEENTNYRHFFQEFHKKRDAEMKKTLADKVQKDLDKSFTHVKDQLNVLEFSKTTNWSKYISQELKRRENKLLAQYNQLDLKDYTRVHQTRKKAKTLRYSATYFSAFAPKKSKKIRKKAKEIQNVCGEITDAHINYGFLYDFATQTKDENDKKLLLTIAQAQRKLYTSDK
ncbi:CHAD domain protein [Liquorilactobacillus aquaticus DSM 21051]|uniref:CHAD domain protein n=1 Tax=Liquorilactobacillus aquaticus DSM 21051 TaxID=1423725 RepID=A0A0R2CUQ6_9LACO|nr:CHAD domain-containing protein [Liquorilactobacillus aquaticus]KRM95383.1 CHAD domain protein [Liquorilactobacillus aquaticus DSM 21051]